MKTLSVLIADDHEVVRQGIRALMEARPECQNEGFDENLAPSSRFNPTAFQAVSFQRPVPRPRQ